MSGFEVLVKEIKIELHPNADRIELGYIDGYTTIVQKNIFKTGDLVAYIPEASIVPDDLLKEMGLVGKLAGSKHNRVKAIRLRGIFSQGLVYPAKPNWEIGQDVTEELGITKYEPWIPAHLSGEVYNIGLECIYNYHIENLQKYPNTFDGELVDITEKIHGTFLMCGLVPKSCQQKEHYHKEFFVGSKGLGGRGLVLKWNEKNESNVYIKAAKKFEIYEKMKAYFGETEDPVLMLGEVYGKGIQDLHYDEPLGFKCFDICIKKDSRWVFIDSIELASILDKIGIEKVPTLYSGPYSEEIVQQYTKGTETLSGKEVHIKEGIVIKPSKERQDFRFGRVILKNKSEKYMLRKKGTEFN